MVQRTENRQKLARNRIVEILEKCLDWTKQSRAANHSHSTTRRAGRMFFLLGPQIARGSQVVGNHCTSEIEEVVALPSLLSFLTFSSRHSWLLCVNIVRCAPKSRVGPLLT